MSDGQQPQTSGPFICALISTLLAAALLIALRAGLRLNLVKAFAILVPVMTFSAMLIAVSMGWAFIAAGRLKQQPRWLMATGLCIALTMVELLVLTLVANGAG